MTGVELWHNRKESWLKHIDVETKELQPNQVVVKSIKSLVSSGTEKLVLTMPIDKSTSAKMALPSMQGSFNSDFTYGYSLVGEIVFGKKELLGQFVHLLHPHQSFAIVEEQDLFFIPDRRMVNSAVLLSNLETVINAIWDSGVSAGDEILVVGYGIIGALLSRVVKRIPGVAVTVLEANSQRQDKASNHFEIHNDAAKKFDIVFNTSTSEEGLQTGINQLRKEGLLVELSWFGSKDVKLNLGGSFHYDRKKIISSQVGSIPSFKSPRWDYGSRKRLALQLLKEIDFSDLLTKEIPFEDTPSFYSSLRKDEINEIGIVINY